jgi:large subunit ribosomal protein L13
VDTLSYRTISANNNTVTHGWWVIDAEDQILGRLSSKAATLLRGKNKPYYTPHTDCGDYVIIINAEKIRLSGKKMTEKEIATYSGYPGGRKVINPKNLLKSKPTSLLERTIKGMLPHTKLGNAMHKKLFVYAGSEHPHAAQKPKTIK